MINSFNDIYPKEKDMKYIIDFIDSVSLVEIEQYLLDNNLTQLKVYNSLGKIYLVESNSTPPVTTLVESIKENVDQPISLLSTLVTVPINDENWWKIASYDTDIAPNATSIQIAENTKLFDVYVVDSGIQSAHAEFANETVTHLYSVDGEFVDYNGHGTAMASLISSATCSIAKANLIDVRIITQGGSTTIESLLGAFDAIKTHSDSRPNVPAVVNMSWAMAYDEYVNAKIQMLINSNIAVVVAAGNSGVPIENVTPASIADAFTVGAYTEEFVPADFSNYTSDLSVTPDVVNPGALDIWAPGTNIRCASINGGYNMVAGTSPAAAIVSGCIAYNLSNVEELYLQYFSQSLNQGRAVVNSYIYMHDQRKNILTLDGPYSSSKNEIVSYAIYGQKYYTDKWFNQVRGTTYDSVNLIPETSSAFYFVYPEYDVSSVTLVSGSLPPGLTLDKGWIVGQTNTVLSADETYKSFIAEYEIVSTDGTITNFKNTIVIRTQDEAKWESTKSEPTDNYLVTIFAQASCLANEGGASCTNDCPVTGGFTGACQETPLPKGGFACACIFIPFG